MSKTRFSIRETLRAGIIPYRNLFPFLRPYVPQFVVALVCGGLFAAATVCVPLVIKLVSAHAFSPSSDQVGMVGNTNADDVKNARSEERDSVLLGDPAHFHRAQRV